MKSTFPEPIRHISLDFWNTIAVPSKQYASKRTWAICHAYGSLNTNTAEQKYRGTKKILDRAAELTGFGTTDWNCWQLLNTQFRKVLTDQELATLVVECHDLFVKYPPTVPAELVDAIAKAKEQGITFNILSNTNFIAGNLLVKHVINANFPEGTFDFMLFSDEHHMAKPKIDFFWQVYTRLNDLLWKRKEHAVRGSAILHIGDNEITDVKGAESVNFNACLVKDPTETAQRILEILQ